MSGNYGDDYSYKYGDSVRCYVCLTRGRGLPWALMKLGLWLLVSCMRSDSRVGSNWKSCDLTVSQTTTGCTVDHVTDVCFCTI